MDIWLITASILTVAASGAACVILFRVYRAGSGTDKSAATYAFFVCLANLVSYALNLVGYIPTPLPPELGRTLNLGLSLSTLILGIAIYIRIKRRGN